jgi:hypothetical protein
LPAITKREEKFHRIKNNSHSRADMETGRVKKELDGSKSETFYDFLAVLFSRSGLYCCNTLPPLNVA